MLHKELKNKKFFIQQNNPGRYKITKNKNFGKKGQLAELTGLAMFFVVLIVIFAFGSDVVQTINENVPDNSTADNVTTQGNQGLQQFAEFAPTIGIIIAAVIVLKILMMLKAS